MVKNLDIIRFSDLMIVFKNIFCGVQRLSLRLNDIDVHVFLIDDCLTGYIWFHLLYVEFDDKYLIKSKIRLYVDSIQFKIQFNIIYSTRDDNVVYV